MKICVSCNQNLPLSDFYGSAAFASGLNSSCKRCHAAKVAAYRALRKATPEGWAALIVPMIRSRAKRRGLVCTIAARDLIVPAVCPILAVPFIFCDSSHPFAPSVDRRDPSKGYVPGNVAVISQRANRMKTDCTDSEAFRRLADWLDATA